MNFARIFTANTLATIATLALTVAPSLDAAAQSAEQRVADSSYFRALDLGAANTMRTGSGRPGKDYWQQRVDYRISATLDPVNNQIFGKETVHYVNNSPETLRYIWFFVEQNLCEPSSITNVLNQPPLAFLSTSFDFSCQGFAGGGTLESMRINGIDPKRTRYGTTMRVELPTPLAHGTSTDIVIQWHFSVPPQGGGRMGHDGQLYEIAQWYPRVAVFDDVHGWNHEPYIGAGEFYLEYGSFDVSLTVPREFIVAATGQLKNADSVLTAAQRSRLARARTSEAPIAIITKDEAGDVDISRPKGGAKLTWTFHADSVRDFAFATGPAFRWDASGYANTLIETLYRTSAPEWEEANKIARAAIKYYSEQWFAYPYSHATTIEGPIEGMEYPMLTFCPKSTSREDLQWVIAHEFGHEWFPMIVGSNERLYPWMDEGFNTFIDLANAARYFAGTPYGDSIEVHPLHLYNEHAIPGSEQPLIAKPVEVRDLFWGGYQKPALMMQMLRYEVLGKDRFDASFREYIRTWAFKHPTPADFFRIMRDESGMELDWFWRGWIYTTSRLDQSVDSIAPRKDGLSNVYVSNRSTMVMPAELKLTFEDGTDVSVKLPVEMWNLGSNFTYQVPQKKRVVKAEIDPRKALPDIDRSNNSWPRQR
ncbi:MAG: M1 family metallopeptidase [Gemmatimonadaceae bacterium]